MLSVKHILVLIFSLTLRVNLAQINLVPNYSFEDYNTCPIGLNGNIINCNGWINANTNGTSNYFNSCVNTSPFYYGVPQNASGYQYAKTGSGYSGAFVFGGPNYSGQIEYVQTQLLKSLNTNYNYCVQFFVSRADSIGDYGISNFGALFTTSLVNNSDPYNIQMTPQIKNPIGSVILDKKNWAAISGTLTAVGGEQYITVGNFDPKSVVDTIFDPIDPSNPSKIYEPVYYYIDDVTVEEVANAQAGRDTIINCGDAITIGADSAIGAYYTWTPSAGLSDDSIAFPIANPTITTSYVLKKQQCNIITYDTVIVTLSTSCLTPTLNTDTNRILSIPNVFTPNGDNSNDTFIIDLKNSVLNEFYLHNRWGNLIHSVPEALEGTNTIIWDGRTTSGEPCSEGVYFYTLKYTDANGEQQAKNGYVSLFR